MLVLWLLSVCGAAVGFRGPYPRGREVAGGGGAGARLLLTPYIEAGRIQEGRKLAAVAPLVGKARSYSGYLTVNAKCQSNLFFWMFPAESGEGGAPVVVWLQGGPGASSLYGLFSELGPFELTSENKLVERKYSWCRVATCVFVDSPVGTGYSYAEDEGCYAKNQTEVGRDLLSAVKQILKLFPEYGGNPFFVSGESYGGKYVPALSYAIHKDKGGGQKVNLQGLAIGNGFVDPVNQLAYSDYLYQISLIDEEQQRILRKQEDLCRELIGARKWKEAFLCFDELIDGDMVKTPTYFQNVTGFEYYFNFLYAKGQPEGNLTALVTREEVRKSIHVGDATWNNGTKVELHLQEDIAQSTRPWLEELLEHYRVLIYGGQLDVIVAPPLTEGYVKKLQWSGAKEFRAGRRYVWRVESEVAGYAKAGGRLTVVVVRNAGHMVPMDQPKWAFDLISRFLRNKPFH